LNL
jgi:hypothetical protein